MNKYVKVLMLVAVILSFCTLCLGFANLQDTLMAEGTVSYEKRKAVLLSGEDFNNTVYNAIRHPRKIIFEVNNTDISDNIDGFTFAANVDVGQKGLIRLYVSNDKTTAYICSNQTIYANPDCSNLFHYIGDDALSIEFKSSEAFDTSMVENMYCMFMSCSSLTSLDLSNFDTSNVKDMSYMFMSCSSLTSLDLSNFNTSNVTGMGYMFNGCQELTSVDLSSFDTSNVTNMRRMFQNCKSLISLDLSSFDTSSVTGSMECMFYDCKKLMSLDLSNFDTSNVTDMKNMFYRCGSLTSLDVSGFDTSGVTTMTHMFDLCGVTSLDLSIFNTSGVTDMSHMFSGAGNLISLDLSSFDTSGVTKMEYMFNDCHKLQTIYVSGKWSIQNVTSKDNTFRNSSLIVGGRGTVYNSKNITADYAIIDGKDGLPGYLTMKDTLITGGALNEELKKYTDITKIVFGNTTDYSATISGISGTNISADNTSDTNLYIVGDTAYILSDGKIFANSDCTNMFRDLTKISSITFENFNTSDVTNMNSMFNGCSGLTSLDLSVFDTSKVTHMGAMFINCKALTSLNISGFNTSNVWSMSNMFANCVWLPSLDLSNFDTSKVTLMDSMFSGCSGLTSLDVSSFNTSNVTWMSNMFNNCSGLTSLDVSNFNTSKVTSGMFGMFRNCRGLTSLDVSKFDTSKTEQIKAMFHGCSGLTSLDLSNFDTSKAKYMDNFFYGCRSLTTIYVSGKWNTAQVAASSNMFHDCINLVGGNGTKYSDSNPKDKTYACIDGKGGLPGYLTMKDTLVTGSALNTELKKYTDVTKIIFGNTTNYSSVISGVSGANVSADNTSDTNLYIVGDTAYILSDGIIAANSDCSNMFRNLTNVSSISFENFNTSEVTNMGAMFFNCQSLTDLDVSGFDTSNVRSTNAMFNGCGSLTSLDLSGFNVSEVSNMSWMFNGCRSLANLDLSNWNTSKARGMAVMFAACSDLKTVYVGEGWDVSNVTNYVILSSGTVVSNSSNLMFDGCTSLVGENGTIYTDDNPKGKEYAHADGGTENPGYLTLKDKSAA